MLTTLITLALTMAMSLGIDVDGMTLPPGACGDVQAMSDTSSQCKVTTKGNNPNQPVRIYNGF
jgi:hypothetical protein